MATQCGARTANTTTETAAGLSRERNSTMTEPKIKVVTVRASTLERFVDEYAKYRNLGYETVHINVGSWYTAILEKERKRGA